MPAKLFYVRIPPQSPRNKHTILGRTFRKSLGWVGPLKEGVHDELIAALRVEPLHELHPESSPKVFEVKEKAAASIAHRKEAKKKKPAGTPDKPRDIPTAKGRAAQKGRVGAGEAKAAAETAKAEAEAAEAKAKADKAKAEAETAKAVAEEAKANAPKARQSGSGRQKGDK